MTGVWPGLRKATVSWIFFMACLRVATEWAWSRSKGSSDVMLTSNGWLLFCIAWWDTHVILTASSTLCERDTFSNQAYSSFKWLRIDSGAGYGRFPAVGGFGFLVMKAGQTFVKASGSSGTFFTFISALSLIGSHSSPSCSELGCWKMEMLVPWNDVFTVSGSWIMVNVVDHWSCIHLLSQDWWTDYSIFHWATTASPNWAEISRTLV